MSNLTGTQPEWETFVATIDNDLISAVGNPVLLRSIHVTTVISADGTLDIEDSVGAKFSVAASAAVGTVVQCGDAMMDKLIVNPHNDATGQITLVYKVNRDGEAGAGIDSGRAL